MSRTIHFIQFRVIFIISVSLSMWGMYSSLKEKDPSIIQSLINVLPFAWISWVFTTLAVDIGDKYNLVTQTQDLFMLIITQFGVVLLINKYYLKQPISTSDIVAFFIIILGLAMNHMRVFSKLLGKDTKEADDKENKDSQNKSDDSDGSVGDGSGDGSISGANIDDTIVGANIDTKSDK